MREMQYSLQPGCRQEFYNHADFCIGTGRMGLALHREYFEQLKLVQAWAAIHEEELYATWNKAVRNEPFGKIEPLR